MNRLLITLLFSLFFSTGLQAAKTEIILAFGGSVDESVGTQFCTYTCSGPSGDLIVAYHARPDTRLSLLLSYGGQELSMGEWPFSATHNGSRTLCIGSFHVPTGNDWAVTWALESRGKNPRVIDAAEVLSGTCP
jgi:hypothetical protein